MGARGPLPKRAKAVRTANGVKLNPLPEEYDRIVARLVRDVEPITAADMALIEDTAGWIEIGKRARAQLRSEGVLVQDTTHGDGSEMRKNPLLIVLRSASEQLRANAQQLGATPMARARMPEAEHEQLSLADDLFAEVMAAKNE